jgi:hypothetical protein
MLLVSRNRIELYSCIRRKQRGQNKEWYCVACKISHKGFVDIGLKQKVARSTNAHSKFIDAKDSFQIRQWLAASPYIRHRLMYKVLWRTGEYYSAQAFPRWHHTFHFLYCYSSNAKLVGKFVSLIYFAFCRNH